MFKNPYFSDIFMNRIFTITLIILLFSVGCAKVDAPEAQMTPKDFYAFFMNTEEVEFLDCSDVRYWGNLPIDEAMNLVERGDLGQLVKSHDILGDLTAYDLIDAHINTNCNSSIDENTDKCEEIICIKSEAITSRNKNICEDIPRFGVTIDPCRNVSYVLDKIEKLRIMDSDYQIEYCEYELGMYPHYLAYGKYSNKSDFIFYHRDHGCTNAGCQQESTCFINNLTNPESIEKARECLNIDTYEVRRPCIFNVLYADLLLNDESSCELIKNMKLSEFVDDSYPNETWVTALAIDTKNDLIRDCYTYRSIAFDDVTECNKIETTERTGSRFSEREFSRSKCIKRYNEKTI